MPWKMILLIFSIFLLEPVYAQNLITIPTNVVSAQDLTDWLRKTKTDNTSNKNYITSNFSKKEAEELFQYIKSFKHDNSWNPFAKKSQSFYRSYYWHWLIGQKVKGYQGLTAFLFYSSHYKNKVNEARWFTTAPVILVDQQLTVLDPVYFKSPVSIKTWLADEHAPSATYAVVEFGQSDARNFYSIRNKNMTSNHDCVIRLMSMYYLEPNDIISYDEGHFVQRDWIRAYLVNSSSYFDKGL